MAARVSRVFLVIWMVSILSQAAFAQAVDPLEGTVVREIRITGLQHLEAGVIERNLSTRVGEPFHRSSLAVDTRRLDELRMFTSVTLEPALENDGVVLHVTATETARLLPMVVLSVTDENGVSAGAGVRTINRFGRGWLLGATFSFGGATTVNVDADVMTITPGTWAKHVGFSHAERRNTVYDFDEKTTTPEARLGRNWSHGLRLGAAADLLAIDTGSSGASLSPDGSDLIPTVGTYFTVDTLDSSTNPRSGTWAEVEVDRLFGDADSWGVILDGRRYQPLSEKHGLGIFALTTLRTGEVGVDLPEYLQFSLGGINSIRGWSLGSRRGRNQFIGSVEYTYVLQPITSFSIFGLNLYAGLQVVGFGDVGLAWNDDLKASAAIDGYGVGLRALFPFVDVIRIDLAWGEPDKGATAYFGLSFKPTRQRERVR